MSSGRLVKFGYTTVELLVVVLVVGILSGMLIVGLSSSRARSAQARCLVQCREYGTLTSAYASDYRDALPAYHSDAPAALQTMPQQIRYNNQSSFVFSSNLWLGFSEIGRRSKAAYCPRVQRAFLDASETEEFWRSDYEIVRCAYIDPAVLDPSGAFGLPHPASGARLQRLGDVRYPAEKVGVLEERVWHAWKGSWTPGSDMTTLVLGGSPGPSSVWFFDGHGALVRAKNYGVGVSREWWGNGPFHMTAYGLHGRDTPN